MCVLDTAGPTEGRWVQSAEGRGPCPRPHSSLGGSPFAPTVGEETEAQRGAAPWTEPMGSERLGWDSGVRPGTTGPHGAPPAGSLQTTGQARDLRAQSPEAPPRAWCPALDLGPETAQPEAPALSALGSSWIWYKSLQPSVPQCPQL